MLHENTTNLEEISQKTIDSFSPIERKIIPFLNKPLKEIISKSTLDETSVIRALRFLEAKNFLKINTQKKVIIDLGENGVIYKKNQLPERRLLSTIEKNNLIAIEEAKKESGLSDNELKASIGVLKGKAMISLLNGKIKLEANKEEIIKKTLEEQLIEILPIEKNKLSPEMLLAFNNLKDRKNIISIVEKTEIDFELNENGKKIIDQEFEEGLIEENTSEIIKNWDKNKKFRRYNINSQVPRIYGGKKHFVNEAIERAKNIWLELGFKEMTGSKCVTSFWTFDALFTAQDHPVREMHDTFFIKDVKGTLPNASIVNKVKQAHEIGVDKSKGWKYKWSEEVAKKVLLRTHTTCLSSQTLAKLKKEDLPAKFYAIGKCFRNETVDWNHGFEFNQSEGIVIDPNANLRHLISYLKEFAKKMGYEKIKICPSFFPYTEPSVEGYIWNEKKKQWIEVLAAGIFRPEVTIPLLGINCPVLAWGPGFDRLMMAAYEILDMREIYSNDLKSLRNKKRWIN